MTRAELNKRLCDERIDPSACDLDGRGRDESYCIESVPNGGPFFYRERGHRNFERLFSSEGEANEFFLNEVIRDPTTRAKCG